MSFSGSSDDGLGIKVVEGAMSFSDLLVRSHDFISPFRVESGKGFSLDQFDPKNTAHLDTKDKPLAQEMLGFGVKSLAEFQDRLYADNRWSLLLIFQAMDAAGKDSAIKHVMSGVNPQGCQVFSFKQPSSEELDHDYLWRCARRLPERGRIGIFNRSYYEDTLVVRVHQELLEKQRLPAELVTSNIWEERFEQIRNFESHLTRNGTIVRKFFLHVSKKEQRKRFLKRLEDPAKHWKFSSADLEEREYWDNYQSAYEEMIRYTATEHAPWYVVPADRKWFTRLVVAATVVDTLSQLNLQYPQLSEGQEDELKNAKRRLTEEEVDPVA
jgi:PPK2 family polyphosphate:nucleotide phosphotransferase